MEHGSNKILLKAKKKHKKRKSKTKTSKTDGKILFCRESKKTLGMVMHSYIQRVFNKEGFYVLYEINVFFFSTLDTDSIGTWSMVISQSLCFLTAQTCALSHIRGTDISFYIRAPSHSMGL